MICFPGKHSVINPTLLPVKNVANMCYVRPEYIQRKRQSVFPGINWDKVKYFLIECSENTLGKI
jgi:hypothetical protein